MIFENMSGRYEKISLLAFKTKIYKELKKVRNKTFQVNFTLIKHSLKRFIKKNRNFVVSFSCPLGLVYLLW